MIAAGIVLMVLGALPIIAGIIMNNSLSYQLYTLLGSGDINRGSILIIVGVLLEIVGLILLIAGIVRSSNRNKATQSPPAYPIQQPTYQVLPPVTPVCRVCGKPNDLNAAFCQWCGTPKKQQWVCTNCGKPLSPGINFCDNCGMKIQ